MTVPSASSAQAEFALAGQLPYHCGSPGQRLRMSGRSGSDGRGESGLRRSSRRGKRVLSDSNSWRCRRSEAARFAEEWKRLVRELMLKRGYPMADFEHQAADISVNHSKVVENYRAAQALADRAREGQEVISRPRATPASINVHGP